MTYLILVYYISILGPTLPGNFRLDVPIILVILLKKFSDNRLKTYSANYTILPSIILFLGILICILIQFALGKITILQGLPSLWGYGKLLLFSLFYSSELDKLRYIVSNKSTFIQLMKHILFVTSICLGISVFMIILPHASGFVHLIYRGSLENTGNAYSISRPVSLFDSVHACAYFFTLTPIVVFMSMQLSPQFIQLKSRTLNNIYILILLCSFLGLFLTSSKAGLLASLVFFSSYYFLRPTNNPIRVERRVSKLFVLSLLTLPLLIILLIGKLNGLISSIQISLVSLQMILNDTITPDMVSDSLSGRLNHGWANAIANFQQNPLFGSVNSFQFIGDGGYTELLSNYGILGLISFLTYLILSLRLFPNSRTRISLFLAILCLVVPTGLFQRRVLEIIPFYFAIVFASSRRF